MKKLLVTVLAGAAALSLAACGKKSNKLVVGTNAAFPPFEYKDGSKLVGFDMDLIRAYGESVGKKVEIKDMEFDAALTSASTGKIDIAIAGITKNAKREETLSFSDAYYASNQVVTLTKTTYDELAPTLAGLEGDAKINAILAALKGKTIGVQRATTGQFYVEGDEDWGFDGIEGATVKPYDNGGLAMKDLKDKKIDAVILDEAPSKNIVSKNYASDLAIIDTALTEEEYAIAVKKGNTELVKSLNEFIKTIKANGEYDKLLEKYFG